MQALFILKIVIAVIGFAFALYYFVPAIEKKDNSKFKLAAIFFFGTWLLLVLIAALQFLFHRHPL